MGSGINIEMSSSIIPENFISSIHQKEFQQSPQAMVIISQMMMELQTSLSTSELIKIFVRHLNSLVSFEQYRFCNEKVEVSVENSSTAVHTCSYDLSLNQQSLGNLTFFRSSPFEGWELEQIENHLASLIFPLRNAREHETLKELIENNQEIYQDAKIF